MFGLFDKKPYEPLDRDTRKWYENNSLWLNSEFLPKHEDRKIFTPTDIDFPVLWDRSKNAAIHALHIIAEGMQIEESELELDFFQTGLREINSGAGIFLENDKENPTPIGLYYDKNDQGKYVISIDEKLLDNPNDLISTLAHELSHVKLLGEKGMEINDEHLTDLATVSFGFGIFNANASHHFYSEHDRWGYNSSGYMKPLEWAYALALSAFYRNEDNPDWKQYLNPSIKKDFERAIKFMLENEADIFNFDGYDDSGNRID